MFKNYSLFINAALVHTYHFVSLLKSGEFPSLIYIFEDPCNLCLETWGEIYWAEKELRHSKWEEWHWQRDAGAQGKERLQVHRLWLTQRVSRQEYPEIRLCCRPGHTILGKPSLNSPTHVIMPASEFLQCVFPPRFITVNLHCFILPVIFIFLLYS